MPELQPKTRGLVLEAELLGARPHRRDLARGGPRLDQGDRVVEPLAAALVGIELRLVRSADAERAVVAGPVAHERVDDVEEGLVAWAQQAVGEHVWVRVAALAGHRVDRLDLL